MAYIALVHRSIVAACTTAFSPRHFRHGIISCIVSNWDGRPHLRRHRGAKVEVLQFPLDKTSAQLQPNRS